MRKLLLALCAPLLLAACNNDDKSTNDSPQQTPAPVEDFAPLCLNVNADMTALHTLVTALEGDDAIESATLATSGDRVGYSITLKSGKKAVVMTGNWPASNTTPRIGIEPVEGKYCWTLDGKLYTDTQHNTVTVESGTAAPQLKVEGKSWWLSIGGDNVWSRLENLPATADSEASLFKEVQDDKSTMTFVMNDGVAFSIGKSSQLSIALSVDNCTITDSNPVEVGYTITGARGEVKVSLSPSDDMTARIKEQTAQGGVIEISAADQKAIDEFSRVVVYATDDILTRTAAITFEKGVVTLADNSFTLEADATELLVPLATNIDYKVQVEEEATSWISHTSTRAMRNEILVFTIKPNTGAAREATIILKGGIDDQTVVVSQKGATTPDPEPEPEPEPDPTPDPEPEPENPPVVGDVPLDKLYGYGENTTGGDNATAEKTHHFNDGNKFREWLQLREKNKSITPVKVYLSGTFTKENGRDSGSPWFDIKRTGNISIYGIDGFKMQNVGFFLNEAQNIIIRNIYIVQPKADNGADGISMQESRNVWVDHCTFESVNQTKDYEDGSCDITHQTNGVTVSWCHFIKTQKSCLVGHSNSASADAAITATFHHNYFDLSSSRHPRVRFGRAHVYNNFFNAVTTYGVGSAYGAMVLVENNLFDGVRLPTDICTYPAKPSGSSWVSNLTGSVAGYLYERDNVYLNKPSNATEPYPLTNVEYKAYNGEKLATPYTYADFKPAYDYIVDDAARLSEIVPSAAGAGKLPGYDKAPVEVDNGGIAGGSGDSGSGGSGDSGSEGSGGSGSDTPATGTPIGNGWSFYNNGSAAGTHSVAEGKLTISAKGKFESGAQTFAAVYREVTGDFSATLAIDSYTTEKDSNQSLAGLMLTPDYSATGTNLVHAMAAQSHPNKGVCRSVRTATGVNAGRGALEAPATSGTATVVRITRSGDSVSMAYSTDGGTTFGKDKTETLEGLADKLYLCIAVNSGDNSKSATAVFGSCTINGEAVPFL